jgi:uncharacterized protein YndB with AHSA1/START domain
MTDTAQQPSGSAVHDGSPPRGLSSEAAVVQTTIATTVDRVWDVLSDGFSYPAWVVGASHMRAVDASWPNPGSRLYHAIGVWPVLLRDSTEVESVQAGRLLVLLAHGGPLGAARVRLDLESRGDRQCVVTMTEDAVTPRARALPAAVRSLLIRARNRESLSRLAAICERRSTP